MRLRLGTAIAATLAAALIVAPAASAKGTAFVSGFTNLVAANNVGPAGGLSPINTTATGNTPRSVAVSPNAKFAFVSNFGGGSISPFTIGANGALTANGTAATAGTQPEGIAISPNGNFLYTGNQGSNDISGFTITGNGTLVPIGNTAAAQVSEVAISGDGRFLYASTNTGVRSYSIDQATGALSPIGGVIAAGTNPKGIATTPDGRFVYVANTGSANVFAYSIGADGSLTQVGSPIAAGAVPETIAIDQNGRFVFVANFATAATVTVLSIGATGELTSVGSFPTGATDAYGIDAAPNGRVYVSNDVQPFGSAGTVSVLDVAANGSLSTITGSPFPAGVNGPEYQSIAITPNQGPTALFTASTPGAGEPAVFNASSSSDPDGGSVATYDWDFGDGSTLPNGGPTPSHVFAQAGNYNVTLKVTDDEGCSNTVIFTGQTADCNPSTPPALLTQTLQVGEGPGNNAPDLKLSGKTKQELAKKVVVKAKTDDTTDAVAKGTLKVEGAKNKKIALKSYDLKKDKETLDGGQKTKLKPKLPDKGYKKAKQALKNGGKVTAKVTVKVTDADDDTDKASLKVKLTK